MTFKPIIIIAVRKAMLWVPSKRLPLLISTRTKIWLYFYSVPHRTHVAMVSAPIFWPIQITVGSQNSPYVLLSSAMMILKLPLADNNAKCGTDELGKPYGCANGECVDLETNNDNCGTVGNVVSFYSTPCSVNSGRPFGLDLRCWLQICD